VVYSSNLGRLWPGSCDLGVLRGLHLLPPSDLQKAFEPQNIHRVILLITLAISDADWSLKSFMVKKRCGWVGEDNLLMLEYHDREWGVPVHDDVKHFEFLVLEGAQAGLSWSVILNKRGGYRRAFSAFDPNKVTRYTEKRVQKLLLDTRKVERKPAQHRGSGGRAERNGQHGRARRITASVVTEERDGDRAHSQHQKEAAQENQSFTRARGLGEGQP